MEDVARHAGVSRQLVSLVMRGTGYVASDKRALVLESAERLGYRRNALASRLASQQTRTVGLLVLDLHNQVYADFADGVASVIEPAGMHLLLVRGSLHAQSEARAIDSLVELRVDGVLLAGHASEGEALRSHLAGTPAVAMAEVNTPLVDVVRGDDRLGAQIAVDHLVAQGHRRIAYIGSRAGLADRARFEGYLSVVEELGASPLVAYGDTTEAGGAAAAAELLEGVAKPDAVFCYNDATAIGAMGEARSRGLSAGRGRSGVWSCRTVVAHLRGGPRPLSPAACHGTSEHGGNREGRRPGSDLLAVMRSRSGVTLAEVGFQLFKRPAAGLRQEAAGEGDGTETEHEEDEERMSFQDYLINEEV